MEPLKRLEIDQYKEKGYTLYKKPLFTPEKFNQLSLIMEEHMKNKGNKRADELDTPHFADKRLLDYLMAPEVLDMVEQLIGPNIGLWSSHFICKEPFIGRRTPWHEDTGYWEGRFDRLDKIVTVWLAIDNSNQQNGCMGVIPGSHLGTPSRYDKLDDENASFGEEIQKDKIDLNKVVWFELNQGECSLHDGRIIHGANANTSQFRRCGYTMRYFDLGMKLNTNHPKNNGHKLFYCRGENIGNNPVI